ncbi:wall-associated receptor kinase-like 9 isoform X2 [Quercus lobata]|nr:wall-associated receptor kinase-like 9 isoform X2 [Quercus lobata]
MKVEKEVKCSGLNCCESTNIPSKLQTFDVIFRSRNKSNDKDEGIKHCKYAFLADKEWLEKSKRDPSSVQYWEYVPVVLEWAILLRNNNSHKLYHFLEGRRKVSCYISDENKDYFYSFFCHCAPGYKGNPYVDGGCEDINECEEHLNNCKSKLDCENTEGAYNCEKRKSKLKIVIVGFGTSLGVLFLPTTWVLYKLIKKRYKIKLKKKFFKKNGGLLLQQQLSSTENNVQNTKLFNSKELEKATDHFSKDRIIGKGGQGTVYKGMLGDGQIIAIKKCNIVDKASLEHFINEIVILSQINHRNVVKLLGCCLETEVPLLIYEFIPNGTLFQYIHEENEGIQLTWAMRLKIAIEIAGALSYLHSTASLAIYHRDIKSTNILLDEKYRAKVADFGTSKMVKIDQTHVTTQVQGTFGYLDPEYFQTGQFTEKSDVYSFGVVLVELLTGEKPVSSTRSEEGRSLSAYFILSMEENRLFDILDDCVRKEGDKEDIIIVANLAKKCLHLNGKERPTMGEVAMELHGIQKKDTNGQENYEELHIVRSKEIDPSYACSTSTQSYSEIASSSSSIVLPSSSFKSL